MNAKYHILRYGTNADQKFIFNASKTFDLLAINGNMLAHATKALSSFVAKIQLMNPEIGYFVDPITHSFQHNLEKIKSQSQPGSNSKIKSSIEKLIEIYGNPIKAKIYNGESVLPRDFIDDKESREFCKRVIGFQIDYIKSNIQSSGLSEYLEFECDEEENCIANKPRFIIPPYFYLDNMDWLDVNLRMIEIVREQNPDLMIYAQIVIPQSFLDSQMDFSKLAAEYSKRKINGILLWIDQFSEHEASIDALTKYVNLLSKFRENNVRVMNLYGSYFSTILQSNNIPEGPLLYGVGHGLEYGESRGVVPVGGGIPTNKYYYYKMHNRIDFKVISEILFELGYSKLSSQEAAQQYYLNVCNCKVCQKLLKDDFNNFQNYENTLFYEMTLKGTKQRRSYASQSTKEICVMHYLSSKHTEYKEIKKSTHRLITTINDMKDTIKEHMGLSDYLHPYFSHLENWITVLSQIQENEQW